MPELPEVETTRRGIAPHITGQQVAHVKVRERRLRWPVPAQLNRVLSGQLIRSVERRAKYLLLKTDAGCVILHLGMSGSLCLVSVDTPVKKHDHLDIILHNGQVLRLNDPRRFGAVLWTSRDPHRHPLLKNLGPEPLEADFDGAHLYHASRGRRVAVKSFLMDGKVVVGVGNIYANEALFMAGIHPRRPAGRISLARYELLADRVRSVLAEAIAQGGTTLRDFLNSEGKPGYFQQSLRVYGREGEACVNCSAPLQMEVLGQRATYFCPRCQR